MSHKGQALVCYHKFAYTGEIPNTGPRQCIYCDIREEDASPDREWHWSDRRWIEAEEAFDLIFDAANLPEWEWDLCWKCHLHVAWRLLTFIVDRLEEDTCEDC